MILIVLNALLFSSFPVIIRKLKQNIPNIYDITGLRMIISVITLAILWNVSSLFSSYDVIKEQLNTLSNFQWGLLLSAGVFSIFTITLYQHIVSTTPLTVVFPILYSLSILFGVLFGSLLYNESINRRQLLGIFLIISGILLARKVGSDKLEQ